ncbi:hypothetical protein KBA63_05250 [Candidatus Woesebacteria bacterium]|jgi:hypothetical protein|nr:hypothetical protein [Candidatus Woesebacteria bacterium]MBP9687880.1 hypothetical protein [Candidatus Woesebacteria bacterium]
MNENEIEYRQEQDTYKHLATELSHSNPEQSQKLLDTVFTQEHREKLVSSATHDIHGRSVRYYREMPMDRLITLLNKGQIDVFDHFAKESDTAGRKEKVDDAPDFGSIYMLLRRHETENLGLDRETATSLISMKDKDRFQDDSQFRTEVFQRLFPDVEPSVIDDLSKKLTYKTLIPFLEQHLPVDFIKKMHTGSMLQKFSPHLSASVGGPINDHLLQGRVTVEMIIPDEQIVPNQFGVTGEKEVFLAKIDRDQISQVFTTSDALLTQVIKNPDTQIGDYYANQFSNLPIERQRSTSITEDWRWKEPTEESLPVSITQELNPFKTQESARLS